MKIPTYLFKTLFLLLFILSGINNLRATTYTVCASGCDFTTIQAAIDDAGTMDGDTIDVLAGVYTISATIDIDKELTLIGPMAGVDPRPVAGTSRTAGSAGEAIIDGNNINASIIEILSDNVTIDGLEIYNARQDMIETNNAYTNIQIKYCIIHDQGTGDEGIQLRNVSNGLIEYNYLFEIAQDAINMCCGSQNGTIQFNEITTTSSDNATIYVYQMGPGIQILDNLLYDNTVNDGIKFGQKNSPDAAVDAMGIISRNIVRNQAQDGISVYTSNIQVLDNEITGSNSDNGAIFVQFSVDNITITGNELTMNTADAIRIGNVDGGPNTQNLLIENNCISGNDFGLNNLNTNLVTAEDNWWGAEDGPSGAGSGSGDAVSANVDFDPFLLESPCIEIVAPIPTLSQWGLIILSLLLLTLSVIFIRKTNRVKVA